MFGDVLKKILIHSHVFSTERREWRSLELLFLHYIFRSLHAFANSLSRDDRIKYLDLKCQYTMSFRPNVESGEIFNYYLSITFPDLSMRSLTHLVEMTVKILGFKMSTYLVFSTERREWRNL